MKIEFLNNTGIQNLRQQLEQQMNVCQSFSIATAFITSEGADLIREFIEKRKSNRTGRLIISLYQSFNSKETLLALQNLDQISTRKVLINISCNLKFHWKYYGFKNSVDATAFIGSANFTTSGTQDAGELTTKLTFGKNDKLELSNLDNLFEQEWKQSISISKFPIHLYQSSYHDIQKGVKQLHPEILKLLKQEASKNKENVFDLVPESIFLVSGYLKNSTQKIISQTKSFWDKNDWDYFPCFSKKEYEKYSKMKCVAIVERFSRKFSFYLSEIKDFTALRTEDGNYFVAHKSITDIRPESTRLRNELEGCGIYFHSRDFYDKKLSKRNGGLIKDLLAG